MTNESVGLASRVQKLSEPELEQLALERWERLRPDKVVESEKRIVDHAPEKRGAFFVVPKFSPQ